MWIVINQLMQMFWEIRDEYILATKSKYKDVSLHSGHITGDWENVPVSTGAKMTSLKLHF